MIFKYLDILGGLRFALVNFSARYMFVCLLIFYCCMISRICGLLLHSPGATQWMYHVSGTLKFWSACDVLAVKSRLFFFCIVSASTALSVILRAFGCIFCISWLFSVWQHIICYCMSAWWPLFYVALAEGSGETASATAEDDEGRL